MTARPARARLDSARPVRRRRSARDVRCVPEHRFTIAKALAWRSSIDDYPPYQRRADRWSLGQRQRFIDSLLNGYDVPKLYLHDLRGIEPTKVYAVVDGKQRLPRDLGLRRGEFPLGPDFVLEADPARRPSARPPRAGMRWTDLDPAWRQAFLGTYVSVVLVQGRPRPTSTSCSPGSTSGVPFHPPSAG